MKLTERTKYKWASKAGGFARDKFAPNPTKIFDALGWFGKLIGSALKVALSRLVHWGVYRATGSIYKKGKHPAWVGSVIYTLLFIGMMGLLSVGISSVFR